MQRLSKRAAIIDAVNKHFIPAGGNKGKRNDQFLGQPSRPLPWGREVLTSETVSLQRPIFSFELYDCFYFATTRSVFSSEVCDRYLLSNFVMDI